MSDEIEQAKQALRARIRPQRLALPPEELAAASRALCEHLLAFFPPRPGVTLIGTMAVRGEIDPTAYLGAWLEGGGRLLLPRVEPTRGHLELRVTVSLDALLRGYMGILEPDPEYCPQADPFGAGAVLVPGLAFDHQGHRLGQGGGHYDRLLRGFPRITRRIGLAHPFQIVKSVPAIAGLDQRMTHLATPLGVEAIPPEGPDR